MQTPVTVVMLLHDIATETDRPVCKVLTGCSWRETRRTSASGDPQRVVHIRLPPAPGYLPYPQCGRVCPRQKKPRTGRSSGAASSSAALSAA